MTRRTIRIRPKALLVALTLTTLATAMPAVAQEEPDEATRERVIAAIEDYVRGDVDLKDAFLIIDPRTGEPLKLTFDHVHEGLDPEGESAWRACVDFTDEAGALYDIDVIVQLGETEEIEDVFLHRVDGQVVEGGR